MKKMNLIANTLFVFTIMMSTLACDTDQMASPENNFKNYAEVPATTKAPKGTFFYGLGDDNTLTGFSSGNPLIEHATVSITGIQPGEKVLAIVCKAYRQQHLYHTILST